MPRPRSRRTRRPRDRPARGGPARPPLQHADRHQVARADHAGRSAPPRRSSSSGAQSRPPSTVNSACATRPSGRAPPRQCVATARAPSPAWAAIVSYPATKPIRVCPSSSRCSVASRPAARSSTPTDGDVERLRARRSRTRAARPRSSKLRVVLVLAAEVGDLARDEHHPVDPALEQHVDVVRFAARRAGRVAEDRREPAASPRASPSPAASAGKIGFASSGTSSPIAPVGSRRPAGRRAGRASRARRGRASPARTRRAAGDARGRGHAHARAVGNVARSAFRSDRHIRRRMQHRFTSVATCDPLSWTPLTRLRRLT